MCPGIEHGVGAGVGVAGGVMEGTAVDVVGMPVGASKIAVVALTWACGSLVAKTAIVGTAGEEVQASNERETTPPNRMVRVCFKSNFAL
jgi:hypothetical protein